MPQKTEKFSRFQDYELLMLLRTVQNFLTTAGTIHSMDEFSGYAILGAEIALERSIRAEQEALEKAKKRTKKEESETFDPNAGSE